MMPGGIIQIDVGLEVRERVEATLNGMLDAKADKLCGAERYERNPNR